MRKLITFLTICLLTPPICSIMADDVSLVEDYSHATKQGQRNSTLTYDGNNHTWKYRKVRINTDKMTDGTTQAIWFSRYFNSAATEDSCYIGCEEVEGGIKKLEFSWKQANASDNNKILCLNVEINDERVDSIRVTGGNTESSYMTSDQSYSKNLAVKSNAKLVLLNKSHVGDVDYAIANGRLFVGPITITPYLYYMQKSVTIGLPNKGYINRNLLDQIDEEHTISYSIDDDDVADINSSTGAITPKTPGTTWVRAQWGDVSTSYELTVDANIYLEAFSKNESYDQLGRNSEGTWDGDVTASWNGKELRRGEGDTIGYFIQGTWMRTLYNGTGPQAYLKSANELEGGMKALSFNWRQWGSGADCSLQMCASYGGTPVKTSDAMTGVSSEPHVAWPFEYEDESEGDKTNEVLEIKNISTRGGNKDPRIVISGITITPWLLYYTKEAELNMRVESAEPTLTFKNEDLIDNTGASPTYSILGEPSIDVQIDAESGEVTVADRFQTGNIEVQAKWSEVTTKYTLHVLGKTNTSITCPAAEKCIGLTEEWSNAFTITPSNASVVYASSNTSVATINNEGVVAIVGVGQTTISATINESENYGASSASYTLYVTDNSASVQVEGFSNVPKGNAATHAGLLWAGDVYNWRVSECGGVRKNNDAFASDPERSGIWMGTPDPNTKYSSLTVDNGAEGGIKHIWFYVEQPNGTGETDYTLKPVVYLNEAIEANKVSEVEVVGTSGATKIAANRKLFGASNVTKSNSVLIIRNESFLTADGTRPIIADTLVRGRILLDEIHITPYLLYTEKSATLDTRNGTKTYKNTALINNTGGQNISYTSSDEKVATVANDGTVTAAGMKGGTITITAKWDDEGAGASTSYELTVIVPEAYSNKETFNGIRTTNNYNNTTPQKGDVATWSTLLGGFNYDANTQSGQQVDDNCARFKARYSDKQTDPVPYIESSTIPGGIKSLKFKCQAGGDESATTWIIRVYINDNEFTVPAENIPTNANEGWKPIEIPDINVAGDFVIRFENQSTISDYNSGNKGRLLIDNIEWEGMPMALYDNDDENATVIENNDGFKRNVQLADRTIRTGGYNTLCLPFALSEQQVETSPLADAKIYDFENAFLNGNILDVRFTKVNKVTAGRPYLVVVPEDKVNPVFESVTIQNINPVTVPGTCMDFVGTFAQTTMPGTALYVVRESLYKVSNSSNKEIDAFRAYFDITDESVYSANIRTRIVANEEVATGMESIQPSNGNVQKVLRDGLLLIFRDGKTYNVQGARVQ